MKRRTQIGFTLIELLITVVVVAVLVAIAAPSFRLMLLNNQSQALGEELVSAIQLARSEAVKRAKFVTLCPSSDGTSCGGGWSGGAIVVVDDATSSAASAAVITTPATDVLRYIEWPAGGTTITGPNLLRYQSMGSMASIGGATSETFSAHITDCEGKKATEITVGIAGMVDVKRTDCP